LTKFQTADVISRTLLKGLKKEYGERLRIALCNTSNYPVPVELFHYPTIKLYPAWRKEYPVEYFGDKEKPECYKSFIKDEGKRPKPPSRSSTLINTAF